MGLPNSSSKKVASGWKAELAARAGKEEERKRRTLQELTQAESEERKYFIKRKRASIDGPDLMGLPIVKVPSIPKKPFLYKDRGKGGPLK